MFHWRKQHRAATICLVLAAILYRGLIPAGFMPASGEAARHGAMLVVCPHGMMNMGAMDMPEHGGKGATSSVEQCPFGAAGGPAMPSVKLSLSFTAASAPFRPDWNAVLNHGGQPRLQPPARGPPVFS